MFEGSFDILYFSGLDWLTRFLSSRTDGTVFQCFKEYWYMCLPNLYHQHIADPIKKLNVRFLHNYDQQSALVIGVHYLQVFLLAIVRVLAKYIMK